MCLFNIIVNLCIYIYTRYLIYWTSPVVMAPLEAPLDDLVVVHQQVQWRSRRVWSADGTWYVKDVYKTQVLFTVSKGMWYDMILYIYIYIYLYYICNCVHLVWYDVIWYDMIWYEYIYIYIYILYTLKPSGCLGSKLWDSPRFNISFMVSNVVYFPALCTQLTFTWFLEVMNMQV